MNFYKIIKAVAWFMTFIGIAAMIPDLTVQWFNFQQFPIQLKMLFVFAAGLMGIGKLLIVLQEVAK